MSRDRRELAREAIEQMNAKIAAKNNIRRTRSNPRKGSAERSNPRKGSAERSNPRKGSAERSNPRKGSAERRGLHHNTTVRLMPGSQDYKTALKGLDVGAPAIATLADDNIPKALKDERAPESVRARKGPLEQKLTGLFPWKKRYCKTMNHFLLYWKNESDYRGDKKALEAYNLLKIKHFKVDKKTIRFVFDDRYGGVEMFTRAKDHSIAKKWQKSLQQRRDFFLQLWEQSKRSRANGPARPSAGARRPSAGPRPLPLSPSKAPVSNFRRPPPGKGLRRSATDPKSASFSGRSPTEERSPTPARRGPPPGKGLRRSSTDPRSASRAAYPPKSRAAYPPKSRAAYPSKKAPYPSATDRLFSKSESSLPVQKSATSRLFNHSASEGNMPPPRPSLVRSGSTPVKPKGRWDRTHGAPPQRRPSLHRRANSSDNLNAGRRGKNVRRTSLSSEPRIPFDARRTSPVPFDARRTSPVPFDARRTSPVPFEHKRRLSGSSHNSSTGSLPPYPTTTVIASIGRDRKPPAAPPPPSRPQINRTFSAPVPFTSAPYPARTSAPYPPRNRNKSRKVNLRVNLNAEPVGSPACIKYVDEKRDVYKLTVDEVSGWLRKLGLNKAFEAKFRENGVNGMFLMAMQNDWLSPRSYPNAEKMHFQFLFSKIKECREKAGDSGSLAVDVSMPAPLATPLKRDVSIESNFQLSDDDEDLYIPPAIVSKIDMGGLLDDEDEDVDAGSAKESPPAAASASPPKRKESTQLKLVKQRSPDVSGGKPPLSPRTSDSSTTSLKSPSKGGKTPPPPPPQRPVKRQTPDVSGGKPPISPRTSASSTTSSKSKSKGGKTPPAPPPQRPDLKKEGSGAKSRPPPPPPNP